MEMRPFGRLIPPLVARQRLLDAVRPVDRVETVPIAASFDRVAARTLRAPRPVPAFARATWDGYALRSSDTKSAGPRQPVELTVTAELFADGTPGRQVGRGESAAVATGAPIPPGADAVVIFEEVERTSTGIRLVRPVRRGDRLARPGEDLRTGERLVAEGELLTPVGLGALAASGFDRVPVYARPVVEVVPNGNELVVPGRPLGPGRIHESNNATLAAVITAAGCIPRLHAPVPDDPRAISRALSSALRRSDLVLATGGSSVGEHDHLPAILPRLGRLLFHGVAVRPGKPTLAAQSGRRLVIGLPGHPTSCLSNMVWMVLPVLRRLARRPGPGFARARATLGGTVPDPAPGFATVVPLEFRAGRVRSTFRGSSSITSLRGATAFAILPAGRPAPRPGERISVFRLDPPLGAAGDPSND